MQNLRVCLYVLSCTHTHTHALHHSFHHCGSAPHILMSALQETKLSAVIGKKCA